MPDVKTPLWRTLTRAGILAGALCMLVGLALYDIVDNARITSAPVIIPLGAGAVVFLAGILLNAGWLRSGATGRKFFVGLNVWAMVALSVALLVIANAIVGGTPQTDAWSLDLTSNRMHTLSGETRNILKGLQKEVRITVLMGKGEVPVGYAGTMEIGPEVKEMVELYHAQSRKVRVEILDAYQDKTDVEKVALRVKGQVEPDSILVECGADDATRKTLAIPFRDLIETPPMNPMSEEAPLPSFKGEEKLTSGILSVTEEKQTAIYFLTGHGEREISGEEGKALNQFGIELKRDNYRVEELNLLQAAAIPAECDLLVIAGPTAPFQESEVKLLREYLEKNGAMLLLAMPRVLHGNLGGLNKLLADYNVQVRDNEIVIEVYRDVLTGQEVGNLQVIIEGQSYGRHPITDELKDMNCVLQYACPVEAIAPEPPQEPYGQPPEPTSPYQAVTLLKTSDRSWGETNIAENPVKYDPGEDEKGPLSLGVAVTRRAPVASAYAPTPESTEKGPRLVVLGSLAVASDDAMTEYPGNRTLVLNSVNWLVKKETRLGIPPQRSDRRMIVASPGRIKAVFFITIVGMPLVAVLMGGFVWWFRRR